MWGIEYSYTHIAVTWKVPGVPLQSLSQPWDAMNLHLVTMALSSPEFYIKRNDAVCNLRCLTYYIQTDVCGIYISYCMC